MSAPVFGQYRALFRAPGAAAFCAAAFVMRMPIAIYPIGIVLVISARSGHYGFAGVLSAAYTFGQAVGGPALAVLVDRYGQRRLLRPTALVHAAAVIALALLVRTDAADGWLVVPAVVFGVSYLSVGSLVRARWTGLLSGTPELTSAMSLESVLDELIFVVGPLIATLIATQTVPVLVLYVALALVVVGAFWLATLHATEPAVHDPDGTGHTSALRTRGLVLLTLATLPMGALFASVELASVAFCGQHGHRALSGAALACVAVGSGLAGLAYGARPHDSPTATRFVRQAALFGTLPFALLLATNVWTLLPLDLAVGLGIAPLLITAFALVQERTPARALTEGLTWINTGLSVGYGAGSAVVGSIADHHGARTAFWFVIGAGVAAALLATAVRARLVDDSAAEPAVVGAARQD
jgi:MFS family permease